MPKKMPEPFIALRKEEQDEREDLKITTGGILNARDPKGILWAPYGGSMGGEVVYAHVHPIRQKICMEGPYCQVCGTSLNGKFIPWLLNGGSDLSFNEDRLSSGKALITTTPPTCSDCQLVSLSLCPHLAESKVTPRLSVRVHRPYGLFGDVVDPKSGTMEQEVVLKFGTPVYNDVLRFFVAKQLVVEITRYKVLD